MSWVRWKGLVAFAVLMAVVIAVWFLVVDGVVKRIIEKAGTRAVGAKVELVSADLTLSPMGLTLTGLAVTNPDSPMTNAVEASRITMSIDSGGIIRRKVIIDEMALDGVMLNTARKTSGAVGRRPAPVAGKKPGVRDKLASAIELPSLKAPDASEILKNEKLRSLEIIESVKSDIGSARDRWERALKDVADKERIEEFKKRIEALKSAGGGGPAGLLGAGSEAVKLQEDIKAYLDEIKNARGKLEDDLAKYRRLATEAAKAPAEDIRRLAEKYSLGPEGLANLGRALFGPKIGEWTDSALRWYERFKPFLSRASERKAGVAVVKPLRHKGVDVLFTEYEPRPDFMIKKALLSLDIPSGEIKGEADNITGEQHLVGAPMKFVFAGDNLQGLESARLDGVVDRVDAAHPVDALDFTVKGYKLKDLSVSGSPELPVLVKSALLDGRVKAALKGEELSAKVSAAFDSVKISSTAAAGSGTLLRELGSVLESVGSFNVEADVFGKLADYDMSISSDLDNVLKDAVGKKVREQTERLKSELEKAISEKVSGPMGELNSSFSGLEGITSLLDTRIDEAGSLFKEAKPGLLPKGMKLPF